MEDLLNTRIKPADKKGRLSYLLKYQLIYRISIILYRYTYGIEKIDRYPALILWVFTGSAHGQNTSVPQPSTGETQERHE